MDVFTKESVVPDVIDAVPAAQAKCMFDGKDLQPGETLLPVQTKDKPEVSWDAEPGALYTLALVGPDAPSRQDRSMGEVMLWLVSNIPGNDIAKGTENASYSPVVMRKDSGRHRFVLLVFKQPGPVTSEGRESIGSGTAAGRVKRQLRRLVEGWRLGAPVAGNMFLAEYDEYCEVVKAQMVDGGW